MPNRANKPESTSGDLAAEHARLTLELKRLRLECTGLRHDNTAVTRERDSLLQENIALRKGEHNREREADLSRREGALRYRETTQEPATVALRRQLEASESELRLARLKILTLEMQCSLAEYRVRDPQATVPKREIARQLRDLLQLCHPDKWQDATVATELTKHLNTLRAAYLE